MFLTVIGIALILFCFILVWMGCWRLYGWAVTGRFIPPGYTRLKGHDLIFFSSEPIRASLEIAGSLYLIIVGLLVTFAVTKSFWRGFVWVRDLPCFLPSTFVLVFISTVSGLVVGHVEWVLPASVLFGGSAVGGAWIDLRQKGLTLAATVSDVRIASQRNHRAHVQKNRTFELIAAAVLCLLGILKLVDLFSH
jgi:hypothetical protein